MSAGEPCRGIDRARPESVRFAYFRTILGQCCLGRAVSNLLFDVWTRLGSNRAQHNLQFERNQVRTKPVYFRVEAGRSTATGIYCTFGPSHRPGHSHPRTLGPLLVAYGPAAYAYVQNTPRDRMVDASIGGTRQGTRNL